MKLLQKLFVASLMILTLTSVSKDSDVQSKINTSLQAIETNKLEKAADNVVDITADVIDAAAPTINKGIDFAADENGLKSYAGTFVCAVERTPDMITALVEPFVKIYDMSFGELFRLSSQN